MNHTRTESMPLLPRPAERDGIDTGLMRQAIASDLFDIAPPPVRIGRFEILRRLGAGSMGEVFAAADPQLDRTVAVKLVRADTGRRDDHTTILLREARALAKLVHPHVVTIFDSGVHDGEVFLAMAYFDGGSLAQWVAAHPVRSRADALATLSRFVAAGAGLAAAHDAGLVHRDFKPANVLLGRDGRVAVADFGLAGGARSHPSPSSSIEPHADTSLMLAGGGTPAYMAPEQFHGHADARADQYAFCVALYEGLVGSRPGASALDADRAELARRMPASAARVVPRWLRAALVRGLASDPSQRFEDMHALLAALDRTRHVARRRTLAAIAIAALGLGTGATWASSRSTVCRGLPGSDAIWSSARRDAIELAFGRTGLAAAPELFAEVDRSIDGWAHAWADARVEACEAGHVRGEQSPARADAAADCLARARVDVDATLTVLAEVDASSIGTTREQLARLPAVARCADAEILDAADAVAEIDRPAYDAALAEAAAIRAALLGGRVVSPDAIDRTTLLALEFDRYPHLGAQVHLALGAADVLVDPRRALDEHLVPASRHALASGDPVAAIAAMTAVAKAHGSVGDTDEAMRWFTTIDGALQRLVPDDPMHDFVRIARVEALVHGGEHQAVVEIVESLLAGALRARTRLYLSAAVVFSLTMVGRSEDAIALGEPALADARAYFGVDTLVTEALLANLGDAYYGVGRLEHALAAKTELVALDAQLFGDASAYVAWSRASRAYLLVQLGRVAEAQIEATAALAVAERTGDDSAILHAGQALSHVDGVLGLHGHAAALRQSLRPHLTPARGEHSLDHAAWDASLAEHLLADGRAREASQWARQAIAFVREHHPDRIDDAEAALVARLVEAHAAAALGDGERGLAEIDGVLALLSERAAAELVPLALRHRGEVLVALGRPREANAAFVDALAGLEHDPARPSHEALALLVAIAATADEPAAAARADRRAQAMAASLGVSPPVLRLHADASGTPIK